MPYPKLVKTSLQSSTNSAISPIFLKILN